MYKAHNDLQLVVDLGCGLRFLFLVFETEKRGGGNGEKYFGGYRGKRLPNV